MSEARETAERVARTSYGRLVAMLSARSGDIAAAEDALADAFQSALSSWRNGIPDRPEAWLLTAARRTIGHQWRHSRVRREAQETLLMLHEESAERRLTDVADPRLRLMFVCAHPAIDEAARTPLMLQTILGIDAARIAAVFLVPPSTMSQRLVRAKAKIKLARIAFTEPDGPELRPRLEAVLAAVYAAYGTAWDDTPGAETVDGLASEAIYLARLLVDEMPDEPEPRGLLALMLYCEARRATRRSPDGRYVPLHEQDPRAWSRPLIEEAERLLAHASLAATLGRYQTEAAIQSFHVSSRLSGRRDPASLKLLYDLLVQCSPTVGVMVGHATAIGDHFGAQAGLDALNSLGKVADTYQPAWAVRAHLLAKMGRIEEAASAFERAAEMATEDAVRTYLHERRAILLQPSSATP